MLGRHDIHSKCCSTTGASSMEEGESEDLADSDGGYADFMKDMAARPHGKEDRFCKAC